MFANLRYVLQLVFKVLPEGSALFLYRSLNTIPGIRSFTNALTKKMVPEYTILPFGTLFLNPDDAVVSGALSLGVYEPYQVSLFAESIKSGMTVVDIGANIGLYSILAGTRVGPGGHVLAFEPEPHNAAFLKKNIDSNGLADTVIPIPAALADREGESLLHLHATNKGRHSLVDYQETDTSIAVRTTTLDSYVHTHNVGRVDIIKIDVEGAEGFVLDGMRETLRTHHPGIFFEFFPLALKASGHDPKRILETFTNLGYTLYEIHERKKSIDLIRDVDALIHQHAHENPANIWCSPT